MKRVLFLVLFLLAFVSSAQANPFFSGRPSEMTATATSLFALPFMQGVLRWQQKIHQALTDKVVALKEGQSFAALWGLLFLSFGYGVFHVLAPGHGKVIVGSYFLGHKARWGDGIWAGLVMATGHTLTAVLIVGVLAMVFGLSQFGVLDRARYVELLGYGLIAAIGGWMVVRALRSSEKESCGCCGARAAPHPHGEEGVLKNRQAMGLFTATSLVPCTGSMIILLFTLANDVLGAGVLAVLAIALGMWLTVSVIGTVSIALRLALTERATPSRWRQVCAKILSLVAAFVVLTTGGLLFAGTLYGMGG